MRAISGHAALPLGVPFIPRLSLPFLDLLSPVRHAKACLPTGIGLFDPLFWRKNKLWCEQTVFRLVQCQLKTFGILPQWKIGLRKGRKKHFFAWPIININVEGKIKIKFLFTFYCMSFWSVQLELQQIEILCFW